MVINNAADFAELADRVGTGARFTRIGLCAVGVVGSVSPGAWIVAFNDAEVTFKWKDHRAKQQSRGKLLTLAVDEFIDGKMDPSAPAVLILPVGAATALTAMTVTTLLLRPPK